ncbi:MAG: hypothetical protein KJ601_01725 [Nanoarchaeota archaeon]|nr:hypothetical protein [Nanoarchaeota archaeon]MBU1705026.1 hypothetical protein [Nanoarchaeota archaeon]
MASQAWKLEGFVQSLENWGLTDILLPFLLIFAVLFAILQKVKVFGERRNINAIVALVISLMTVIPHVTGWYDTQYDPVEILKSALPAVSIVVIAIVMLLVLIGIFGGEAHIFGLAAPNWIAIISILTIVFIFGGAAGWWGGYGWFEGFFGSDAVAIIIMLLVFGVIISFVTGEGTKEELGTMKRFGVDFGKIFGGGK